VSRWVALPDDHPRLDGFQLTAFPTYLPPTGPHRFWPHSYDVCARPHRSWAALGMGADDFPFNAFILDHVEHFHFHVAVLCTWAVRQYETSICFGGCMGGPPAAKSVRSRNRLIDFRYWRIYPYLVINGCYVEAPFEQLTVLLLLICLLQCFDVNFIHLEHCLHYSFRFLSVFVIQHLA
jgi:hypothetical protein